MKPGNMTNHVDSLYVKIRNITKYIDDLNDSKPFFELGKIFALISGFSIVSIGMFLNFANKGLNKVIIYFFVFFTLLFMFLAVFLGVCGFFKSKK
jgi:hypothetical protein